MLLIVDADIARQIDAKEKELMLANGVRTVASAARRETR
jgi:hypothetical protein